MKKRQVVITGAGACGLMAAIMAARNGAGSHCSGTERETRKENLCYRKRQM